MGDNMFDSLVKLVEHYEKTPLYRKMKLKFAAMCWIKYFMYKPILFAMIRYPVDAALVTRHAAGLSSGGDISGGPDAGVDADDLLVYSSDQLYHTATDAEPTDGGAVNNRIVRALHAYRAAQANELSFPKGAYITHVVVRDGGWWQGDYGGMKGGYLPSNFVEDIDPAELAALDEVDDGTNDRNNPLGTLEKAHLNLVELSVRGA